MIRLTASEKSSRINYILAKSLAWRLEIFRRRIAQPPGALDQHCADLVLSDVAAGAADLDQQLKPLSVLAAANRENWLV
jgi:hypothetical protein